MMSKLTFQRGETDIFSVTGIVLIVGFSLFLAYLNTAAQPNEVRAVYALAEESNVAKEAVKSFLTNHPTPTKGEIKSLKFDIEKMVTLDVAKKITGNPNLKTDREIEAEKKEVISSKRLLDEKRVEGMKMSEMTQEEIAIYSISKAPFLVCFAIVIAMMGLALNRLAREFK